MWKLTLSSSPPPSLLNSEFPLGVNGYTTRRMPIHFGFHILDTMEISLSLSSQSAALSKVLFSNFDTKMKAKSFHLACVLKFGSWNCHLPRFWASPSPIGKWLSYRADPSRFWMSNITTYGFLKSLISSIPTEFGSWLDLRPQKSILTERGKADFDLTWKFVLEPPEFKFYIWKEEEAKSARLETSNEIEMRFPGIANPVIEKRQNWSNLKCRVRPCNGSCVGI